MNLDRPRYSMILVFVIAVVLRLAIGAHPIDDAFITFRYARNFVNGDGLVYNLGDPVLGTSTPLWVLLLGSVSYLTGKEVPAVAVVLSALADGVSAVLLYCLGRRLELPEWAAMCCGLVWAVYPLSLHYAVGGMETSLVVMLLSGVFLSFLSGYDVLAIFLASLALLTRFDSAPVLLLVFLGAIIRSPRRIVSSLGVTMVIVVPWFVFSYLYYGTLLPQSLVAKTQPIYLDLPQQNILQILYHLGGILVGGVLGLAARGIYVLPMMQDIGVLLGAAVMVAGIWILGAKRAIYLSGRWWAVLGYVFVVILTYAFAGLRGGLVAEWYLVPLSPVYFLGVIGGWEYLTREGFPRFYPVAGWTGSFILVLLQIAGLNLWRNPTAPPWQPRNIWTEREELYRRVATQLQPVLEDGDVVAASEIGALGYYCECEILDTVGLVSPQALSYYPLPREDYVVNYAVPSKLIYDVAPKYLVSLDVFWRNSLLNRDWFWDTYELWWETEAHIFGSEYLQVFVRHQP